MSLDLFFAILSSVAILGCVFLFGYAFGIFRELRYTTSLSAKLIDKATKDIELLRLQAIAEVDQYEKTSKVALSKAVLETRNEIQNLQMLESVPTDKEHAN